MHPRSGPTSAATPSGSAAATWARCPPCSASSCSARSSPSCGPSFLTAGNFANLFTQGAAVTVIAMGLVFVLLLGEIDLSAGFASGVCAAVLAIMLTNQGLPWYVAVGAAILTGVVIGTTLGSIVAKLGIPSFVVTLAAFLAFQGTRPAAGQGRHHHRHPRRDDPRHRQQEPPAGAGLDPAGRRGRRLRGAPAPARTQAGRPGPDLRPDLADRGPGGRPRAARRVRGLLAQPGAQPQRGGRLARGRADRGARSSWCCC